MWSSANGFDLCHRQKPHPALTAASGIQDAGRGNCSEHLSREWVQNSLELFLPALIITESQVHSQLGQCQHVNNATFLSPTPQQAVGLTHHHFGVELLHYVQWVVSRTLVMVFPGPGKGTYKRCQASKPSPPLGTATLGPKAESLNDAGHTATTSW